jgi:hypothetical protein
MCSTKAIAAPVPRMLVGASVWSALISVGPRTVKQSFGFAVDAVDPALSSQPAPVARHYERKWCGGAGRFVGALARAIVLRLTNLRWLATPISSPARAA